MARLHSNIFKLKTTWFLWGLAFYMPVITLYFLDNKVSLSAIVIPQVFYSIFTFIGEVPTGVFADKVGQKYAVIIGHLLNAVAFGMMLFMPNEIGLFAGYGLLGLADSFLSGSSEAILYESSPKGTFKKHLGQFLANETIGFAIGTALAGLMLSQFGADAYRPVLLLTIAAKLLAFVISLTLVNPKREIQIPAQGRQAFSILRRSFSLIKRNKTVWTLTLVTILTLSGEYFLYGVYQPYFEAHHVEPVFFGIVLSTGAVLNFFVMRYIYLLEKWLPLEKIVLLLNGILAVGYISMALLVNPIFLIVSFIFLKGFFNTQVPIINDYIHEQTSSDIRATVMSGISLIKSLFQIGARLLLGFLVGAITVGNTLLIQGVYLAIGVMVAYWLMVKCGCTHKILRHHENAVDRAVYNTVPDIDTRPSVGQGF